MLKPEDVMECLHTRSANRAGDPLRGARCADRQLLQAVWPGPVSCLSWRCPFILDNRTPNTKFTTLPAASVGPVAPLKAGCRESLRPSSTNASKRASRIAPAR